MIIAIDGPSGAGKSTVAKLVSRKLGFEYIDTGAMYRAIAYKAEKNGVIICDESMQRMLENTSVDFEGGEIVLDGEIIEPYIRNDVISALASMVAKLNSVRSSLVTLQRCIASGKNVVLDGRDIGTVVFPDAEFKFYVTASAAERARRRFDELKQRGQDICYEQVLEDIKNRDINDSTRELSPLKKADDAVLIDTTAITADEVCEIISSIVTGGSTDAL